MDDEIRIVRSVRCALGDRVARRDALSVEAPLRISLNGERFCVTMRTPGDDLDLVRGLLLTEGVARNATVRRIESDLVEATVPEPFACPRPRPLMATSSCGLCGSAALAAPDADAPPLTGTNFDPSRVAGLVAALHAGQSAFRRSGGCHAAGLFAGTRLLALAEDVGRHNAVDKAVGRLIAAGQLAGAEILVVSGRVSYEIVAKAYRAAVPTIVAVSAPTSMAVSMAERLGILLFAFCREGRSTAYSRTERLAALELEGSLHE